MTKVAVAIAVGAFIVIVIIVLYDVAKSGPNACAVNTRILLPDVCEGACPVITSGVSMVCKATATRPYFGGVLGGKQDSGCACFNPPGLGGGAGTGGTGGGTSGRGGSSGSGSGSTTE